ALHHDRELGVLPGHVQQLGGPLALLPQWLPLTGVAPWQQQGPSRALPEAPREERGATHVIHHIGLHDFRELARLPVAPADDVLPISRTVTNGSLLNSALPGSRPGLPEELPQQQIRPRRLL